MMSETTKAFVAGAILPTTALILFWYSNRNNTNNNNNNNQLQTTTKDLAYNNKSTSKNNNKNKDNGGHVTTKDNEEDDIDENDIDDDDDDSSGQLSLDDDNDSDEKNDINNNTKLDCSNWGMKNVPYKMVLCVNIDLSMGKGKIAAQCCHAAVGCYKRSIKLCPAAIRAWEYTGCAKIAVKCPTVNEMTLIATKAKSLNIPFYLVEDAGRTQIAAGSKTVLSLFGPVNVFEGITDHLKLM